MSLLDKTLQLPCISHSLWLRWNSWSNLHWNLLWVCSVCIVQWHVCACALWYVNHSTLKSVYFVHMCKIKLWIFDHCNVALTFCASDVCMCCLLYAVFNTRNNVKYHTATNVNILVGYMDMRMWTWLLPKALSVGNSKLILSCYRWFYSHGFITYSCDNVTTMHVLCFHNTFRPAHISFRSFSIVYPKCSLRIHSI